MSKMGFLVNGENFVWSHRGLLKIKELKTDDVVLGIDEKGKPHWSIIPKGVRKHGRTKILRITTDGNEILLPESCEVFTMEGVRRASSISRGELLETFNIPKEICSLLESKEATHIMTYIGPVTIKERMAYLLGTQIKSRKYEHKVIISRLNPNHTYTLAKICSEALREQFIRGKIYYVAGGKKIRIDCDVLASICIDISERNIPLSIRESNATALKEFLCGILDVMLYWDEAETPPTYFQTFENQSELRRFMFNVLRLYRVIPAKTYAINPSIGPTYMRTFVDASDLSGFGLRFIRTERAIDFVKPQIEKMSYSTVRSVSEFTDIAYYISEPKLHWSPIVELTPLHRHILP